MATTEEVFSSDGTPLGRSNMKGVVHRNAVEGVTYGRVARHIESQRRAFLRQNTRDEDEMKSFLCRLQGEQQLPALDSEDDNEDGDGSDEEVLADPDSVFSELHEDGAEGSSRPPANPYPITIVPRLYAHQKCTNIKASSPEASKPRSRKSSHEDDLQDSMSALALSSSPSTYGHLNTNQSGVSIASREDDMPADWLATPDAISSIRRPRKSISEQSFRKVLRRTNSEHFSQQDLDLLLANQKLLSPSKGNVRSNSMKDRRRSMFPGDPVGGEISRRGGSLKERKSGMDSNGCQRKKLARSYSLLTRSTLTEFNKRQEADKSDASTVKSLNVAGN